MGTTVCTRFCKQSPGHLVMLRNYYIFRCNNGIVIFIKNHDLLELHTEYLQIKWYDGWESLQNNMKGLCGSIVETRSVMSWYSFTLGDEYIGIHHTLLSTFACLNLKSFFFFFLKDCSYKTNGARVNQKTTNKSTCRYMPFAFEENTTKLKQMQINKRQKRSKEYSSIALSNLKDY